MSSLPTNLFVNNSKLLRLCHSIIARNGSYPLTTLSLGSWQQSRKFHILMLDSTVFRNVFIRQKSCFSKGAQYGMISNSDTGSSYQYLSKHNKRLCQNISMEVPLVSNSYFPLCLNTMPLITQRIRMNSTTSFNVMDGNISHSVTTHCDNAISDGHESDQVMPNDPSNHDSLEVQKQQASDVRKKSLSELSGSTYNLAPFVEKSLTLQNLVRLGVDLSRVEKVSGMTEHLLKSDFDKDILPYLQHLANVGVEADKLGVIVSANPRLLQLSLSDLEAQVGYLLSKKFSLQDVASMYSRAPVLLLMEPAKLDAKLGFLQKTFKLSGHDIRTIALTFPKLLTWKQSNITSIRFTLKEFLGFSDKELRQMIVAEPKMFAANKYHMMKTFDFVHNTMLIPHEQIVQWPAILRTRLHIIKSRHLFLLHKGRAQYDPHKENYVSMKRLVSFSSDEQFCQDVAGSNILEYYNFLKTL